MWNKERLCETAHISHQPVGAIVGIRGDVGVHPSNAEPHDVKARRAGIEAKYWPNVHVLITSETKTGSKQPDWHKTPDFSG